MGTIGLILIVIFLYFGWLKYMADHAPIGYEDKNGFHYGNPPDKR